jgi:hypothetical protein
LALCPNWKPFTPNKQATGQNPSGNSPSQKPKEEVGASIITPNLAAVSKFQYVLLKCCKAFIADPANLGRKLMASIFIDGGNQRSLVSEKFMEK